MIQNIKLIERDEKLTDIVNKTDKLQDNAHRNNFL